MTDTTNTKSNDRARWVMVAVLVVIAFFGAYKFASARNGQTPVTPAAQTLSDPAATPAGPAGDQNAVASSGAGAADACCGGGAPPEGGVTGPKTEGVAVVEGGVQKISIDVSSVYTPNSVKLKAGVPAEITFSQAQGCTQYVESPELGFSEDLSGGPKTVRLPSLQAGTYAFSCGMQMVFGQIVVE